MAFWFIISSLWAGDVKDKLVTFLWGYAVREASFNNTEIWPCMIIQDMIYLPCQANMGRWYYAHIVVWTIVSCCLKILLNVYALYVCLFYLRLLNRLGMPSETANILVERWLCFTDIKNIFFVCQVPYSARC